MKLKCAHNILVVGSGEIALSLLSQNPGWVSTSHRCVESLDLDDFTCVINASFDPSYFEEDMDIHSSFDAVLASRCLHSKYVFLSTRLVYQPSIDICEDSKKIENGGRQPEIYGFNKLLMEKTITSFHDNTLVLRLPNIISHRTKTTRYWGQLISTAKQGVISLDVTAEGVKDLLSADDLANILRQILEKDCSGIFNVAYEEKLNAGQLVKELTKYIPINHVNYASHDQHEFSLNSRKLGSVIDLKPYTLKFSLKNIMEISCTF